MLLFRWELVRVMKINYHYCNGAITVVFIKVQWNPENTNNKKTLEGVFAGCVGVRKNYRYVEWQWKVEWCINNKCVQERRRGSVKD